MMHILIAGSFSYAGTGSATNEIWLQDTQCVLVFSTEQEVKTTSGSLISSVCLRKNNIIICSDTAKDSTMNGGKPSKINTYKLLGEQDGIMLWDAINYEGKLILNLSHKKYTVISTNIGSGGILTKQCIGDILQY